MAGGSSSRKRRTRRRRSRKPSPAPAAQLTDDLLVEILGRVPYRSLCRFRCVSTHWRALISHPDNSSRLPQTLAGFFYADGRGGSPESTTPTRYRFTDMSGSVPPFVDPSFSFLPDREREHLVLVDTCNGLLLCRCYRFADENEFQYLVLNPANEKWVAVPITQRCPNKLPTARLGFDPADSSHFHVFEFQLDMDVDDYDAWDGHVLGVKIYSSASGVWIHKQSGWGMEIIPQHDSKSVFLDGVLYIITTKIVIGAAIGAVDVEGKTWRIIHFPRNKDSPFDDITKGFIDLSQGRLHFTSAQDIVMVGDKLAIWVLEDKDSEDWTLKHTVPFKNLAGRKHAHFGFYEFIPVAIHPDRNMVFFVLGFDKTLMSYDMDSGKVCMIRNLGHTNSDHFLPYVPLFSKSLLDGGNE